MKRIMGITLLVFALVISASVLVVFAAEQTPQSKKGTSVEKNWQQALKTQVALAKTRIALLEARSELWLDNNRDASLRSLEEAKVWYGRAQTQGEETIDKTITDMGKRINQVEFMLKKREGMRVTSFQSCSLMRRKSSKAKNDGIVKSYNPGHCEERSDVAI